MKTWKKWLLAAFMAKVILGIGIGIGFWLGRQATLLHDQPIIDSLTKIVAERQGSSSAPASAPTLPPTSDQISKDGVPHPAY